MIKMINKLTGTEMLIEDDRLDEYKALGHLETKSSVPKKAAVAPKEEPKESPVSKVKKTVAKVTKTARKKA